MDEFLNESEAEFISESCPECQDPASLSQAIRLLGIICLMISIVALIVHIAVYAYLPKLRTIPGKIIISLSVAILIGDATFLASFTVVSSSKGPPFLCQTLGVIRHYSSLASFCWMTIMAFDVLRAFRAK